MRLLQLLKNVVERVGMVDPGRVVFASNEPETFDIRFQFHIDVFFRSMLVLAQSVALFPSHLLQHLLSEFVSICMNEDEKEENECSFRSFNVWRWKEENKLVVLRSH